MAEAVQAIALGFGETTHAQVAVRVGTVPAEPAGRGAGHAVTLVETQVRKQWRLSAIHLPTLFYQLQKAQLNQLGMERYVPIAELVLQRLHCALVGDVKKPDALFLIDVFHKNLACLTRTCAGEEADQWNPETKALRLPAAFLEGSAGIDPARKDSLEIRTGECLVLVGILGAFGQLNSRVDISCQITIGETEVAVALQQIIVTLNGFATDCLVVICWNFFAERDRASEFAEQGLLCTHDIVLGQRTHRTLRPQKCDDLLEL
ncbi:hypothetical protein FQZ97_573980 [compost metagenome]